MIRRDVKEAGVSREGNLFTPSLATGKNSFYLRQLYGNQCSQKTVEHERGGGLGNRL